MRAPVPAPAPPPRTGPAWATRGRARGTDPLRRPPDQDPPGQSAHRMNGLGPQVRDPGVAASGRPSGLTALLWLLRSHLHPGLWPLLARTAAGSAPPAPSHQSKGGGGHRSVPDARAGPLQPHSTPTHPALHAFTSCAAWNPRPHTLPRLLLLATGMIQRGVLRGSLSRLTTAVRMEDYYSGLVSMGLGLAAVSPKARCLNSRSSGSSGK